MPLDSSDPESVCFLSLPWLRSFHSWLLETSILCMEHISPLLPSFFPSKPTVSLQSIGNCILSPSHSTCPVWIWSPVLSLNSVSLPQSLWAQQNHLEGLLKHKSCNFTPRISVSEDLGGGQDFAFLQVPSCYLSREQTFSPIAID